MNNELPELDNIKLKDGETLITLDETRKIATALCEHQFTCDEENQHNKHWVCTKCGYGKYFPILPN